MDLVVVSFQAVAAALQFAAAYYAYRLYVQNRMRAPWLAIVAAMAVMGLRRVMAAFLEAGMLTEFKSLVLTVEDAAMPLAISILVLVGLREMHARFESFEVVERRAEKKAGNLDKKAS